MRKRRQRRWGLVAAVAVGLVAVAAIALLVMRPARVVGVSDDSLSSSVRHGADATSSRCKSVETGRRAETAWRCSVAALSDGGSSVTRAGYAVQATEWGCWEAQRIAGRGRPSLARELAGCVWLADYVLG